MSDPQQEKLVSVSVWMPESRKKRLRHLAVERGENGFSKTAEEAFSIGLDQLEQMVADQSEEPLEFEEPDQEQKSA